MSVFCRYVATPPIMITASEISILIGQRCFISKDNNIPVIFCYREIINFRVLTEMPFCTPVHVDYFIYKSKCFVAFKIQQFVLIYRWFFSFSFVFIPISMQGWCGQVGWAGRARPGTGRQFIAGREAESQSHSGPVNTRFYDAFGPVRSPVKSRGTSLYTPLS